MKRKHICSWENKTQKKKKPESTERDTREEGVRAREYKTNKSCGSDQLTRCETVHITNYPACTTACCCSSHVRLLVALWTVARHAPLSMGIFQARILEWVAMPSSRGSSQPKDWTHVSWCSCIADRFFTAEPPGKPECVVDGTKCSILRRRQIKKLGQLPINSKSESERKILGQNQ